MMLNAEQTIAGKLATASPIVYLGGWLMGLPWPQIAAMLAALWTIGLMWKSWIWTPFLKPWWDRKRGR
jgi:hypothetical protein